MPASFKEADKFYNTSAWRKLAGEVRTERHYICERCGKPANIVHHKIYLTPQNITDPKVALNKDNLELLCHDCHDQEHERMKYGKHLTKQQRKRRRIGFDEQGLPYILPQYRKE